MSNNDLHCERCQSHHHPVDCPMDLENLANAGCISCAYLGSENDGAEPEYSKSWPICERFPRYSALKSFPFKKKMPCFRLDFWQSEFAEKIVTGEHEEILKLMDEWAKKYPDRAIAIANKEIKS